MYSPLAFFAFNRPYHTYRSLDSLCKNKISIDTEIFAFIDGPRNNNEIHLIDNVEKIINSFSKNFKKITIIRSDQNLSSGSNKRIGINNILSKYDSIIVLEDDICVSTYFLDYMNSAIRKYKNHKEVWHINGFNFPNNSILNHDAFFTRSMQFWGWATWQDRWFRFNEDPLASDPFYLQSKFDRKAIKSLNLDLEHDINWSQVLANADGKLLNTLAIFWQVFIFMKKGLCLAPRISLTKNIGYDGSGDNCPLDNKILKASINQSKITKFPEEFIEDQQALDDIKKYFNEKYSIKNRILLKLKKILRKIKELLKN